MRVRDITTSFVFVICLGFGCASNTEVVSNGCREPGKMRLVSRSGYKRPDWTNKEIESSKGISLWKGIRTSAQALDGALTDARMDAFRQVVEYMGVDIFTEMKDTRVYNGHQVREKVHDVLQVVAEGSGSGWREKKSYWEKFERCMPDGSVQYEYNAWVLVRVDETKLEQFIDQRRKKLYVIATLNKNRYVDGDEVELTITVTKDAYVYVLAEDRDGVLALIFPNSLSTNNLLRKGSMLRLPDEAMSAAEMMLRARFPEGKASASEKLLVMASCSPVAGSNAQDIMQGFIGCLDAKRAYCCAQRELPYQIGSR